VIFRDDPTTVAMAIGTAGTLNNMLRGIGYPPITAAGKTVEGKALSDSLLALRDEIDKFLKRGS
jgi:hypothetical protein